MDVMIAAGPFTSSADLVYAPLADLIKTIDTKPPVCNGEFYKLLLNEPLVERSCASRPVCGRRKQACAGWRSDDDVRGDIRARHFIASQRAHVKYDEANPLYHIG